MRMVFLKIDHLILAFFKDRSFRSYLLTTEGPVIYTLEFGFLNEFSFSTYEFSLISTISTTLTSLVPIACIPILLFSTIINSGGNID